MNAAGQPSDDSAEHRRGPENDPPPSARQPVKGDNVPLEALVGRQIQGLTPDGQALVLSAFAGQGEITLTWDTGGGYFDTHLYAYWSKRP